MSVDNRPSFQPQPEEQEAYAFAVEVIRELMASAEQMPSNRDVVLRYLDKIVTRMEYFGNARRKVFGDVDFRFVSLVPLPGHIEEIGFYEYSKTQARGINWDYYHQTEDGNYLCLITRIKNGGANGSPVGLELIQTIEGHPKTALLEAIGKGTTPYNKNEVPFWGDVGFYGPRLDTVINGNHQACTIQQTNHYSKRPQHVAIEVPVLNLFDYFQEPSNQ